jgi:hypothetical protein
VTTIRGNPMKPSAGFGRRPLKPWQVTVLVLTVNLGILAAMAWALRLF